MIYNKDKKYSEKPLSGAQNYINHIKCDLSLPENIIICPVSMLTKIVQNNYKNKFYRLDGDIYILEKHNCAFVTNFGMGSPAFAMMMEVLVALGCKNFFLIGIAGALQKDIKTAEIVLCEKALRDEGVSANYIAPGDAFSFPSKTLNKKLENVFKQEKRSFSHGPTWTTDALFRETVSEVLFYQKQGIVTVEMEAAAAFAIAEHHKVDLSAAFVISDSLASLKWEPAFGHKDIDKNMHILLDCCIKAFK
ncbi:Purine-nucleoside phosphorylase [Elusimicrobium minutum Pei191]|uniref:Uridine phosphorylase n=1 Tax=Elusimicrobium minutum (strain Pei191) TaxID=445932 RepID=B2KAP2_ELUMP|nr:nucleoside phosphorylase [Elusimicrobium minutum]ACC97588.1 Purine-nucleoside phosphorylase [Elusimicrobium minutum Pei191]